tara:strand:- start:1443 stop:1724 length:282 start_codon:yes stop_codon:yes gene_type:complete
MDRKDINDLEYIMCRVNKPPENKIQEKGEWVEGRLIFSDKSLYPQVKFLVFSLDKKLWTFEYNFEVDASFDTIRFCGNIPCKFALLDSRIINF